MGVEVHEVLEVADLTTLGGGGQREPKWMR